MSCVMKWPLLCSDENWWRGETQLGTGLFPASFVSTNLSVDPEPCECGCGSLGAMWVWFLSVGVAI